MVWQGHSRTASLERRCWHQVEGKEEFTFRSANSSYSVNLRINNLYIYIHTYVHSICVYIHRKKAHVL